VDIVKILLYKKKTSTNYYLTLYATTQACWTLVFYIEYLLTNDEIKCLLII